MGGKALDKPFDLGDNAVERLEVKLDAENCFPLAYHAGALLR